MRSPSYSGAGLWQGIHDAPINCDAEKNVWLQRDSGDSPRSFVLFRSMGPGALVEKAFGNYPTMNAELLRKAGKVIPHPQMLVNVVRLRVRQLNLGHRPLVAAPPGMGLADVALMEIGEEKLSFERTPAAPAAGESSAVVAFPAAASSKKAG